MVKLFYDYKKISGMMAKTEKAFMAVIKATVQSALALNCFDGEVPGQSRANVTNILQL